MPPASSTAAKNKNKRKTAGKVLRKKRKISLSKPVKIKNLAEVEDVLFHISHVQIHRKSARFAIPAAESFVVENLLRDAEVEYTKSEFKGYVVYDVEPGPEREEGLHALDHLEELDDEILEDGQVFG